VTLGIDFETCLITDHCPVPPPVCMSYAYAADDYGLLHWTEVGDRIEVVLKSAELVVGHHVAFDMCVVCAAWPDLIPLVFEKYERDEITCTEVREKLLHIAGGVYRGYRVDEDNAVKLGYSLAECVSRHLGVDLEKGESTWRLRYGELREVPVAFWPEEAREYAEADAVAALELWRVRESERSYLKDEFRQARASFWLELMSAWGFATDPESVRAFARKTQQDFDRIFSELIGFGLVRPNGTRNVKAVAERVRQAYEARGLKPPRTPKGKPKTDYDTCELSRDPVLQKYAELSSLKKTLSTDIPLLERGVLHVNFESMLETGRTASSPNIQNLPTEPGVRECFAPRLGWIYAVGDYPQIELRTWAQVCLEALGHSKMAEALKNGLDPHTDIARRILGISYEEAIADYKANPKGKVYFPRQAAKSGNFGFPGGLGVKKFVDYARRNYGVVLTEEKAEELRNFWYEAWEGREYFQWVKDSTNDPRPTIKQFYVDRFRGDVSFTEASNGYFQSLAADIAKAAGFLIAKACYADPRSPLYGCRPVNFAHDEFIVEVPDDERAHDAAMELGKLMEAGARPLIPNIPCEVEPMLCRRWSKLAKPMRDSSGRLVPWDLLPEAAE